MAVTEDDGNPKSPQMGNVFLHVILQDENSGYSNEKCVIMDPDGVCFSKSTLTPTCSLPVQV